METSCQGLSQHIFRALAPFVIERNAGEIFPSWGGGAFSTNFTRGGVLSEHYVRKYYTSKPSPPPQMIFIKTYLHCTSFLIGLLQNGVNAQLLPLGNLHHGLSKRGGMAVGRGGEGG